MNVATETNAVSADILVPTPDHPTQVSGNYATTTPNGSYELKIGQVGPSISATYSGIANIGGKIKKGKIEGRLVGDTLIGRWSNEYTSKYGPIVLGFQGKSFTGVNALPRKSDGT